MYIRIIDRAACENLIKSCNARETLQPNITYTQCGLTRCHGREQRERKRETNTCHAPSLCPTLCVNSAFSKFLLANNKTKQNKQTQNGSRLRDNTTAATATVIVKTT